ncbi:MAG: hypothetical protein IT348_01345 [Candidatus Eisenbacteria bacterium]|nr:hypothetical protein [Candidatus Eisenbacteria bacterium]
MRPLAALLTLALLAAAAGGCSQRERANPLDPVNPQTGGRPEGFNATSGFSVITIAWTPRPDLAVDGFQLYRLAPGDSLYRPLGDVRDTRSSGYVDSGVLNGLRYRYRLFYVVGGTPGSNAAEDEATAGPLRPYVADPGAGALVRLTPDGRDVTVRWTQFGDVQSLAMDAAAGTLWVSAWTSGVVAVFDPNSGQGTFSPGIQSPYTLAVDPVDHSAWICDLSGSVHHRAMDGGPGTPGQLTLLDDPIGIAVGPDRSVWVCEGAGNRVRRYDNAGAPQATAFLSASPSRVAVDGTTRVAWVTSLNGARLWRISENGTVVDSSGAFSGPIGLAIDRPHGRVWVADAAGNRVIALDINTLAVLRTVTGIGEPRSVAVDFATGQVWVVARGERSVIRLSNDGEVLDRTGGFSDPFEIALDPGL